VDIYGSYFFFSLSSRLPLVALFIAVLALVGFLGAIAWTAWPAAVLVMCVLTGVLISLQFIVYGCHRFALGLAWILRGFWLGAVYFSNRVRAVFVSRQGTIEVGSQTPVIVARALAHPVSARAFPQGRHTS